MEFIAEWIDTDLIDNDKYPEFLDEQVVLNRNEISIRSAFFTTLNFTKFLFSEITLKIL